MTTGAGKLLCTACGRTYESKTSYTAHYTNNQCLKMIIPGMIEDHDDNPQDDAEGEEDQEQPGKERQQNFQTSSNFVDNLWPNSVLNSGCLDVFCTLI